MRKQVCDMEHDASSSSSSSSSSFNELLRRLTAGDQRAAEQLVRDYEPVVRREVRFRLRGPGVRAQVDSMDICQSVLAGFFVRAAGGGGFDLNEPADLVRLLVTMTRNKVAEKVRWQHRRRRDSRRTVGEAGASAVTGDDPSPSRVVSGRELLDQVRQRLGAEERRLAELRAGGRSWDDIAAELGGTPGARRKQLARALDRVAGELGVDSL